MSHKLKHHRYCLKHLNVESVKMLGARTQCNIKRLDDVKFSNCQPLAITRALSLNCHRTVCYQSDVASTHQVAGR